MAKSLVLVAPSMRAGHQIAILSPSIGLTQLKTYIFSEVLTKAMRGHTSEAMRGHTSKAMRGDAG